MHICNLKGLFLIINIDIYLYGSKQTTNGVGAVNIFYIEYSGLYLLISIGDCKWLDKKNL